jgi:hypothetical protein
MARAQPAPDGRVEHTGWAQGSAAWLLTVAIRLVVLGGILLVTVLRAAAVFRLVVRTMAVRHAHELLELLLARLLGFLDLVRMLRGGAIRCGTAGQGPVPSR